MSTGTTHSTPLTSENAALLFPALSPAQISGIGAHGLIRPITRGEVLIEAGQTNVPFFVVKAGEIEVIRPSGLGALLIAIVRPNQFTDLERVERDRFCGGPRAGSPSRKTLSSKRSSVDLAF